MRMVVGLGNPGTRYAKTRHNVGFMVLNTLCDYWELKSALGASVCKRGQILYVKPQTFMNLSGTAVQAISSYFKIAATDIIIIYDDKDLPLGTVRFRKTGSSGGHNGIKSIIASLGTEELARLKVGVAPATTDAVINDTADYVLGKFTAEELKTLSEIIATTRLKLDDWIKKIPTDPNV